MNALYMTLLLAWARFAVEEWSNEHNCWEHRRFCRTRRGADRACGRWLVRKPLRAWPQRFRVRSLQSNRAVLYLLRANPRFAEFNIHLEDRPHV